MQRASSAILTSIEPVVRGMGYEFVGAEFGGGGGNARLRVYIDTVDGVTVDDCAAVSEQLSATLDVDDPIPEAYVLEVSSPGINRPLFERADFVRFQGERVFVRLREVLDGRKRFKGQLIEVADDRVSVEVDGRIWQLPLVAIEEAHLVAKP